MEEKLKNKKVIVVSSTLLIMTIIVLLVITLKDSYAYYGTSNELEIMKATIGKLKPTIDKVYIETENQLYTNKTSPNVTITWSDDNITEYCVTTEGTCSTFTAIQDSNSKSVITQIQLSEEGNHTVYAYIKNKYGYTSLAFPSSITLDTTAPTISNVASTEITETSIKVKVTANSGDVSGVKQYCYGTSQNDYTCTDSSNHTFSNLSAGKEYTFWFYLVDNAGNDNKANPTQKQFTTESKTAKDVVVANSKSLESEEEMQARNDKITTGTKDDLRRFVGDYKTVIDNFICFGTTDQTQCKNNMDTYMYRIIGIDTSNRLKLIKATKIVKNSADKFAWYGDDSSDIKWNASSLYSGLNNGYFMSNTKYGYMQQDIWTDLISPVTYYIGDSIDNTNPQSFVEERKEHFDSGKISLMYLSDYLYANNGIADTTNWLFIQNGLNRDSSNLGNGAPTPAAGTEWTMTRYAYYVGWDYCRAWAVNSSGTVGYGSLAYRYAVRPVFYLTSSTRITDGNGTIENPYMIAPWVQTVLG